MLSEKLLDILQERRAKVLAGGGDDKLQERHAKGLMGARERLLNLFQPDTFQEIGTHAKHAAKHFGLADKELPSDGVIVGTGFVDGRPVAAFSQDFTVMGGTLGKMHAKKIVQVMQMALKTGRR
jgi:acetyl-CoA carboxylase carboxyltransferase component